MNDMTQDEEHLRLLSIFHYLVGGIAGLFALLPLIHVALGLFMIFAPRAFAGKGQPPPPFLGWLIVILASGVIVLGWIFAALIFTAGRFLAKRKHCLFCLVMAGIECIFTPFGTVLEVFTIIVLNREPVKALFATARSA
jgi:hypothetical protein